MQRDTVFRGSVYLTLALATLNLASADEAFLPGMMRFLIPVEGLIGLAFLLEGRWSLTPFWSNLIGLLIAIGSGIWIAWNITSPANQWFRYAPYPIALLPYAAPLVMVLMLAKLFRSASGPDFWMLQGVGLMQVALACTLADDLVFGVWLFAYLTCGLWSLGLHAQSHQPDAHARDTLFPRARVGLVCNIRRTLLVVALGLAWFLVMPRYSTTPWSLLGAPAGSQFQTGYSPRIDLNYTGPIQSNELPAFEVYAEDAQGRPYTRLNPEQRWRGTTLDLYAQGRWIHRHLDLLTPGPSTTVPVIVGAPSDLPDLGPGQFYLFFNINLHQANGLFLADPVTFSPAQGRPPVCSDRWRWVPYFHGRDATFYLPPGWTPHHYHYCQVALPQDDTVPRPAPAPRSAYHLRLLQQTVPRLNTWTREVLNRLVAAGQLTPADVVLAPAPELNGQAGVLPQNRDKVARALTEYLASSGEFTYKLEMRRHDFSVDAIEDFLCNVKQGYCEQFATGLVLMLRAVGIPARLVNGYRGAESEAGQSGREGWYVVRQSQAHSWAEALLTRKGPDGEVEYYWRMLDPTPGQAAPVEEGSSWQFWWRRGLETSDAYWRELILGYTRSKQENAVTSLWDRLALDVPVQALARWWESAPGSRLRASFSWSWLAVPAVLILAVGLWRWARRWRRRRLSRLPVTGVGFYNQFLALIARHCRLQPLPAQTPWEFGEVVGQTLRAIPAAAGLAAFPGEVVRHYYRVRFGGQTLRAAEDRAVARQLHELEQALVNRGSI